MRKSNKEGALSLSVNAIVVLILAIVMLGLGLGFMTNMFGDITGKLDDQINKEPNPSLPSRSEPITLSRESVTVNAKDTVVIKASVYNPSNEDWNVNVSMNCSDGIEENVRSNAKPVAQGDSETFNILFDIGAGTSPGSSLCLVYMNASDYQKDLIIEVE